MKPCPKCGEGLPHIKKPLGERYLWWAKCCGLSATGRTLNELVLSWDDVFYQNQRLAEGKDD